MAAGIRRGFAIERGTEACVEGRNVVITQVLDLDSVMAQDIATGKIDRYPIAALRSRPPASNDSVEQVPDLSKLDGQDWDEARRRAEVVKNLLAMPRPSRALVGEQAEAVGASAATMYRWMRVYRNSGRLSSLLPPKPSGGKGKSRLPAEIDTIIDTAIKEFYLTKQAPTIQATTEEVARLCRNADLPMPHVSTVGRRIAAVTQSTRLRRRNHAKLAEDTLEPRPGHYADADCILAVVQIDHTRLDVMVVDEETRLSIGRPWITLAIDVFSRMVTGLYVSLDPPGANNTGLCISQAVLPKETWLTKRGIATSWPCWGFPRTIHLDNAREFRGEMLKRACEQYGVELVFRPLATPHFGAHIERMMGTLATAIHELPGTTFSNPKKKGTYDSEHEAAMTLAELESYLVEYVVGVYHQRVHSGIGMSPLAKWTQSLLGTSTTKGVGHPNRPDDEERIRLDFMPFEKRTIQNYGVRIHEIHYYSDVLRRYMTAPEKGRRPLHVFRVDPSDISRVHFWDDETKQYYEIPYRDMRRPSMTLWELREVRKRLGEQGKADVDEELIFKTYESLREKRDTAVTTTKRVRRQQSRKRNAVVFRRSPSKTAQESLPASMPSIFDKPIVPFKVERA